MCDVVGFYVLVSVMVCIFVKLVVRLVIMLLGCLSLVCICSSGLVVVYCVVVWWCDGLDGMIRFLKLF